MQRKIFCCTPPLLDEVPRQSDPVVELRESVVHFGGRHLSPREKIELIAEIDKRPSLFRTDAALPRLDLIDNGSRPRTVELHEGKRVIPMFRQTDRHDGEREGMRAPLRDIANRTLQLLPVVQPVAEHYLRMVLRARLLEPRELTEDI